MKVRGQSRPSVRRLRDIISRLKTHQASGSLIPFVGAGVSVSPPSSLPLAGELSQSIAEGIWQSAALKKAAIPRARFVQAARSLRLEVILQTAQDNCGPLDHLIGLFRHGQPNHNHRYLATLAKAGQIGAIITTNFDVLIEMALVAVGVPFSVYATPERFSEAATALASHDPTRPLPVIKLHGSVDLPGSIAATLTRVAHRDISDGLRTLFRTFTPHWAMLFLGYSLGDDFDINPIFYGAHHLPEVFYVQHGDRFHYLGTLDRPFSRPVGHCLSAHTTHFLRTLVGSNSRHSLVKASDDSTGWREHVATWATSIRCREARITAAGLLYEASAWEEALAVYRTAVGSRATAQRTASVTIENNIGTCYFSMERFNEAKPHYEAAIRVADAARKTDAALALANLAHIYAWQGAFRAADKLYCRAAAIAKQSRRPDALAAIYVRMAILDTLRGRYARTVELSSAALDIAELVGDPKTVSQACGNLVNVFCLTGRICDAEDTCKRDVRMTLALGHEGPIAQSHLNYAQVLIERGDYSSAVQVLDVALRHAKAIRSVKLASSVDSSLGLICYRMGRIPEALAHFRSSLDRKRRCGDKKGEIEVLRNVAAAQLRLRHLGRAQRTYVHALSLADDFGVPYDVAECVGGMGLLEFERKRYGHAIRLLMRARDLYRGLGAKARQAMTFSNMGAVYQDMGRWRDAAGCYRAAVGQYLAIGQKNKWLLCRYRLACLYAEAGRRGSARRMFSSVIQGARALGEQRLVTAAEGKMSTMQS